MQLPLTVPMGIGATLRNQSGSGLAVVQRPIIMSFGESCRNKHHDQVGGRWNLRLPSGLILHMIVEVGVEGVEHFFRAPSRSLVISQAQELRIGEDPGLPGKPGYMSTMNTRSRGGCVHTNSGMRETGHCLPLHPIFVINNGFSVRGPSLRKLNHPGGVLGSPETAQTALAGQASPIAQTDQIVCGCGRGFYTCG